MTDRDLLRTFDEHYAPGPLDAPGRARFDARLRERLEGEGRSRGRAPLALAGFAAAGVAALLFVGLSFVGIGDGTGTDPELVAWEWELLLGNEHSGDGARDADLPDEYVAIAGAFLDPTF